MEKIPEDLLERTLAYVKAFFDFCHLAEGGKSMDEVKMLISCVVEKEGRKIVRLSFLREMEERHSMEEKHSMEEGHSIDYAEGILPEGIVVKSEGFTEEEVSKLEAYIRANRKDILKQAKEINPLRNWINGK